MKVIDLLDKFNLSKLEKNQNRIESDNFVEKNNDFSGGEKIRIGVARALLSKRPLLIFDEPTNSLDLENRQQVIEAIKEIYETTNTTLIIVAHNPDEFNFANKILRIKNASVYFETK
jgi:ABC-type transport system involved in cytochrome bd biosynthesis fused ATPase/permease subunit